MMLQVLPNPLRHGVQATSCIVSMPPQLVLVSESVMEIADKSLSHLVHIRSFVNHAFFIHHPAIQRHQARQIAGMANIHGA
jgi:hypothetical protein